MSADIRGKAGDDLKAQRLSPGAHLRAEILRLGLDQVAVSKTTGVSRQTINNIVNGRQPVSRAMAGKLGRLTGHSSDYWLAEYFLSGTAAPERIVGSDLLVNHQILQAVQNGIIGIKPFVTKNLQAACLNLTLNNIVTAPGGAEVDLGRGKRFVLKPGHSVNAATQERIELPSDYLGRIGAVGSLSCRGIIASHAMHIEPGFKGQLQFCLFNASALPFALHPRAPVISLEFVRLSPAPADAARS